MIIHEGLGEPGRVATGLVLSKVSMCLRIRCGRSITVDMGSEKRMVWIDNVWW